MNVLSRKALLMISSLFSHNKIFENFDEISSHYFFDLIYLIIDFKV